MGLGSQGTAGRRGVLGLLGIALWLGGAGSAWGDPAAAAWRRDSRFPSLSDATAVAVSAQGPVAVGTSRTLWWSDGSGPGRRVPGVGTVRDLRFDSQGVLWVATDRGVQRVDASGRVRTLAPGRREARQVERIGIGAGHLYAGTRAGVYISEGGRRWVALDGAVPAGPVTALAAGGWEQGRVVLWVLLAGSLRRIPLEEREGRLVARSALRQALPGGAGPSVDLLVRGSGALLVLGPKTLTQVAGDRLRTVRPPWPPGLRARRISQGAGRLWVASDAGILSARAPEGPWRRARGPMGRVPTWQVRVAGEAVFAAGARGLWLRPLHSGGSPAARWHPPREPRVRAVQRVALRYLGLGPERMRKLRAGVDRRGWLPSLELRSSYRRGRRRVSDSDQTFSSGALHRLLDHRVDRDGEAELSAVLRWDFGDVLYHPEAIDVSRESRAVIQLRDEVLDEVTQLYFERCRVLAELAAQADPAGPKAQRLRIRAEELGSGLDAWTGGWWSQQLGTSPFSPRGPARESKP